MYVGEMYSFQDYERRLSKLALTTHHQYILTIQKYDNIEIFQNIAQYLGMVHSSWLVGSTAVTLARLAAPTLDAENSRNRFWFMIEKMFYFRSFMMTAEFLSVLRHFCLTIGLQ